MPFKSDVYLCPHFSHPFIWTVYWLAKDRNQEQREKATEYTFSSTSLRGRMILTACKDKPRDDGEKGVLYSQGTACPCEASLFQTSQLIINCSTLAAASFCLIWSIFAQQARAIIFIGAGTRNAIFSNCMEYKILPHCPRVRIGQLPVTKDMWNVTDGFCDEENKQEEALSEQGLPVTPMWSVHQAWLPGRRPFNPHNGHFKTCYLST